MPKRTQSRARPRLRRWLLLGGLAVAAGWFAFFDSHSLVQRLEYRAEAEALAAQRDRLQTEIEGLQYSLDAGLSDEVIERVAREQYGMRRPGETVYPVEEVHPAKDLEDRD